MSIENISIQKFHNFDTNSIYLRKEVEIYINIFWMDVTSIQKIISNYFYIKFIEISPIKKEDCEKEKISENTINHGWELG